MAGAGISSITSVGDCDGDDRADLIARTKHGRLMLCKGDGRGTLTCSRTLSGVLH
jgi:stage II sporulation protein D